ncbi:MAG: HAD hydrolase family protein, partial [Peptoniphilaceae bacterium]|nr:HAD hydrolase family protein [Peptoniphilaceae bacterium]
MKLIGLDVDGTLINTKKEITKRTKDSLIKAMNQGHKVAIVSGRPTAGVIDLAKDLEFETYGGLLSNFNGGMISDYKTKKILVSHTLDRDLALEIIDFTKDLDIEIMIPHMDNIYTRKAGKYAVEEARYLGLNL